MTTLEKQFAQTVAEHKSTIYTVCYMFSQDADEVNDLFQEVLVNLWTSQSLERLRTLRASQRHQDVDLPRRPEHLYLS